jgi:hypothetical protein
MHCFEVAVQRIQGQVGRMDFLQSSNLGPVAIKPIRSWTDFFQTASFRTPTNMEEAQQRLTQNLKYFQSNYLVVFALLLVYCL